MIKEYEDIINLPRHISKSRPPMKAKDRAAQFSSFAALTGHDDAIKETARVTNMRVELSEDMKVTLNKQLQIIIDRITERPEVEITYFQPDGNKKGGAYLTVVGFIKKIDNFQRILFINNGEEIPIDEIINIEGQIFETLYKE